MNAKLFTLAAGNFMAGISTFVIAPLLGQISADLHAGRAVTGQLIVVYALAYALGGPLLTTLVGHRPPRQVLLVALVVFGVGNGLTAVAMNFPGAAAARVVAGVGAGVYTANALAVTRRLVPADRQGRAVSVVVGGLTTAIVLGIPVGAWLGSASGWRLVFGLLALATTLPMAGTLLLPALDASPAVALRDRVTPLRDRRVLATLLATWLCLTASWTVYNFIDEVLQPATGGDPDRQFLALLVFGAGAVAGNLLASRLADRYGPGRTIALVAPGLTVAVLVVPLAAVTMLAGARRSVGLLHQAGVRVLAGTDTNDTAGVPFQPEAGTSLHHELQLLVEAGLSTVQALRAASSLAARAFGLTDRGAIVPGQRADLILVDGDPLADIRATRSIRRIWCGGIECTPAGQDRGPGAHLLDATRPLGSA